ncbi:MAG: hypothetical protein ACKVT2_04225 [Saprospiraceae bacterium]
MNKFLIFCIMAIATYSTAQKSPATTIRKTFSRTTSVSTVIKAEPDIVWALLTNAADLKKEAEAIQNK